MAAATPPSPSWLVLLSRLPKGRSSRRVALWRRLKRLGARPLGGAAWALPDGPESREALEWLRADVVAAGGAAALVTAAPVDAPAAAALEALARGEQAPAEPAARERLDPAAYRRRTWVTRPRPGVDRMACAWLIRRFVDPAARFVFAERAEEAGRRAVPFDMYGAALGHQGGRCSFEVIVERFGLEAPGLERLGRLVRAVDLDEPFEAPAEAALLGRLVEQLRAAHADDRELLEAGLPIVEALATLMAAAGTSRPRRPPGAGVRRAAVAPGS